MTDDPAYCGKCEPDPPEPTLSPSSKARLLRSLAGLIGGSTRQVIDYLQAAAAVGEPGPVAFPRELLQQGAVILARGLLTTLVIQRNKHWLLPFWLQRQLDPGDPAYLPRAMNPFLLNQCVRSWSATGTCDSTHEVIVDPRGMTMPWRDGWSVDVILQVDGRNYPAAAADVYEMLVEEELPLLTGRFQAAGVAVTTRWLVCTLGAHPRLFMTVSVVPDKDRRIRMGILIRPFNPEGVSPVHSIRVQDDLWYVNGSPALLMHHTPDEVRLGDITAGDAAMEAGRRSRECHCRAGLANGAAFYDIRSDTGDDFEITVTATTSADDSPPAIRDPAAGPLFGFQAAERLERAAWKDALAAGLDCLLPDASLQRSFTLSRMWLLLMDDGRTVHPGPYTYHHHWFRDSAYILCALARLGFLHRVPGKLLAFPDAQRRNGYFMSQNGEWDSTGQAIWTIMEYYRLSRDRDVLERLFPAMLKGCRWIERRRMDTRTRTGPYWGLMPAGFSAEHFGPNDHYLWDNFWSLAGLKRAAEAAGVLGFMEERRELLDIQQRYHRDVQRVLAEITRRRGDTVLPPAPGRVADASSIGILAACYPLQLMEADDPYIAATVDFLMEHHVREGAFLHATTHSGYNAYLTCHLAQCLAAAGDRRALDLVHGLLAKASPTMNWPEAIHPRTGFGCMGDGMHGWASADWLLLLRTLLFHEQEDQLILTPVAPPAWFEPGMLTRCSAAPTGWGPLSFNIKGVVNGAELSVTPAFRTWPRMIWRLPMKPRSASVDGKAVEADKDLAVPAGAAAVRVTF
ncbi:hypothetical protein JW905_05755 [bacterium]|nr:hypothetical protein [candidate division CSSED10-310 bacterium]